MRLHEDELKRATLVAAGLATVGTALANQLTAHSYRAAQAAALRVASRSAGRLALRAVPLVGVLATSGGNVLSTQLDRAPRRRYFRYLAADAVEPAPLKRTTTSSSGALNAAPSKPITV